MNYYLLSQFNENSCLGPTTHHEDFFPLPCLALAIVGTYMAKLRLHFFCLETLDFIMTGNLSLPPYAWVEKEKHLGVDGIEPG